MSQSNLLSALILGVAASAIAQTPPAPAAPAQAEKPAATTPAKPTPPANALKKYDEVITKEAVTQKGMFKVHRIEDKVYWEIPPAMLGRLFFWQTEIAEIPSSLGYPGTAVGTRMVRFTRRGNKIYLRNADVSVRSVDPGALASGVAANSIEPIIGEFDVQTEGDGKAPVIDVTGFFTSDPQDFSVKSELGATNVDAAKSYIDRVKAFPENIETRSQLTFNMQSRGRFELFFGGGIDTSTATVIVHYSLDLLPATPMMGRLKDSRIGYFTTDFTEYGRKENRSVDRRYINRFRLAKKDPTAALSEPVKPIVFYLAREVPEKWRPYMKKAIEDWRPAFEQAGFKNAIVAKDAPSVTEDANWDPEDARYSVIRWAPSKTENAMGPSVQDPRSGETLSAHVIVWNDIVKLVEDWYFSQCAAIDPRARHIPMSDEMVGSLLRYVVAHEVGHTLGLEHNFKGSVAFTIAQLRDPAFTDKYGVAASIMSYSRYNYVAQPGDGVRQNWGMVGPYDKFAIEYGYKPISPAETPDDEKRELDILLARQVTNPWLRFGNYKYMGTDPTTQTENISNDPVEAARLGLLNIDRIATNYLEPATTKFGEDYETLTEMYRELLQQRFTELTHVLSLVGGVVETDYHAGRGGPVFQPVPAEQQAKAVHILVTQGFATPPALFNPHLLSLMRPYGGASTATALQTALLESLLSDRRAHRLQDLESVGSAATYSLADLVSDVTDGAWSELATAYPKIEGSRRALQRDYLKTMDHRVNGTTAADTDMKPIARETLRRLAMKIDKAIPHSKDRATIWHLVDCRRDIVLILEGKYSPPANSGMSMFEFFGIKQGTDRRPVGSECWEPGAAIRQALLEIAK